MPLNKESPERIVFFRQAFNPFRILMIAPTPFYSGRGTHMRIFHEAQALAERGHKITIVTYHIGDKPPDLHPNIRIKRINRILFWYTKRSSGPNWQKILLDLLLLIKVLRIVAKKKPEILHGHLHEGVLIGWMVKKLLFYRKLVLVGDFHGPLVHEMRSHGYLKLRLIQKIFSILEQFITRLPMLVFASSAGLKQQVEEHRHAQDAYILPDAPTLAANHKQINPHADILSDNPNNRPPIIVYTGGFTPDKGLEHLFEVISLSIRNGLQCRWIIAGGPMNQLAVPPEIDSAITVVSPLSHDTLYELLINADIACDPKKGSVLQGSGKLLNYMYMGLPVVCFDGPTQRYYLGERLSEKLLAKDIPDFYNIIKKLLNLSQEEKNILKKEILVRAAQFTWPQIAQTLEAHYINQWKQK